MKLRTVLRPALLCAAVPVCLFLSACDPVDDPNAKKDTWRPEPEPLRKVAGMDPDNELWLAAWRDLRTRLTPLQTRLAELQKLHAETRFDSFLNIDASTLNAEQLSSLYHFLQRGYFTVERRVLMHLLERRLDRTDPMLAIPSGEHRSLKQNLATAMHRDEIRMVDLETAIKFYEETGDANFQVSTGLSEEETAALRDAVSGLLNKTRTEIATMDRKIAGLRAKAFPGQYPGPPAVEEIAPPETAPAVTTPADNAPPENAPLRILPGAVPLPEVPPVENAPPADAVSDAPVEEMTPETAPEQPAEEMPGQDSEKSEEEGQSE